MDALDELYHDLLLDHGKHPRHFGPMAEATNTAEGFNPLCGDRITVHLQIVDGEIRLISFEGKACAVCTASASIMTQMIGGLTAGEAIAMFQQVREYLTAGHAHSMNEGDLTIQALSGVRRFPMRVKCATLPWHTLIAALNDRAPAEPVSTE